MWGVHESSSGGWKGWQGRTSNFFLEGTSSGVTQHRQVRGDEPEMQLQKGQSRKFQQSASGAWRRPGCRTEGTCSREDRDNTHKGLWVGCRGRGGRLRVGETLEAGPRRRTPGLGR